MEYLRKIITGFTVSRTAGTIEEREDIIVNFLCSDKTIYAKSEYTGLTHEQVCGIIALLHHNVMHNRKRNMCGSISFLKIQGQIDNVAKLS